MALGNVELGIGNPGTKPLLVPCSLFLAHCYTVRELRDRSGRLSEDLRLVPFDVPELRHGATGDWWALGQLEGSVRNPDGSRRTFTVEVGLSLIPHGDILHREEEFWQMVAEKLPLIAKELRP